MVLLCNDGSPTAKRAMPAAGAVLGHKPATVLHVWEPPRDLYELDWFGGIGTGPTAPIGELGARALKRAEATAGERLELARSAGFAERAAGRS